MQNNKCTRLCYSLPPMGMGLITKGYTMDENTTTESTVETGGQTIQGVAINDQGQAVSEPETTDTAEAVQATDEPSQDATQDTEPSTDDNSTAAWLKKKGVDPSSPEAIEKVAEMARNAEKAMHSKAQKASELEKAIDQGITDEADALGMTDGDRLEIARIKTRLSVRDFFDTKPEAKQFEQAMVAELQKKPHLAGDLESLYANAVINSGGVDSIKSQAGRDSLEKLAQKQQAAVPRGNAVTATSQSNKITPQNVDQMVASMSPEEYRKRLPEINAAMAG